MTAFADLLALQDRDTTIDQLVHRRANLPERIALRDAQARRAALAQERSTIAAARDEIAERQQHAEREIAASEERIQQIDTRMRSGAVTASRDLQAMEGEIASIRHRISTLEDTALEAMDEREPLDAQVDRLDEEISALDSQMAQLRETIATAEAEIDRELAVERETRAQTATAIAADLLSTYERLRSRLGGVGAARLEGDRCTGCHLTLPATEIDRFKREPADTLVFCDQCGRILVRS